MKIESITVDLRLSTRADSKVKAFADATIPLGDDGTLTIFGFSILQSDGRPTRVMSPARKGKQSWFPIVEAAGRIRSLIDAAILAEYERQVKAAKDSRR